MFKCLLFQTIEKEILLIIFNYFSCLKVQQYWSLAYETCYKCYASSYIRESLNNISKLYFPSNSFIFRYLSLVKSIGHQHPTWSSVAYQQQWRYWYDNSWDYCPFILLVFYYFRRPISVFCCLFFLCLGLSFSKCPGSWYNLKFVC